MMRVKFSGNRNFGNEMIDVLETHTRGILCVYILKKKLFFNSLV